jgi:methylenetetrahydrofolate--tRNA-(uracil-5-)-methyltransferase
MLKTELKVMKSKLLAFAYKAAVPAGGALAVDREVFSELVLNAIEEEPNISFVRGEINEIPEGRVIIATGPLTSNKFAEVLKDMLGLDYLAFYDAASPVFATDSLDMDKVFVSSRYDRNGSADYLNAPLDKETYEAFITELVGAKRVVMKDFERKELFAACQPVEEVARTGIDALRHGAMKPMGLTDPRTGRWPYAVVQLRKEDKEGSAYNPVGFQTNLTFPEQERVFRMIPGLENAEFMRHGVMHRNTFIDAPALLDHTCALCKDKRIRFAGQIMGTEGYVEAIASGLLAALNSFADIRGLEPLILPRETVFGALIDYATSPETKDYQPMHVNRALLSPLENPPRKKRERAEAAALRSKMSIKQVVRSRQDLFGKPEPDDE